MADHHVLIIGCGSIGHRHVRAFIASGRCRVTACDSRADTVEAVGREFGIPTQTDWAAALADASITGVVVATPAQSHISLAIAALSAGKHVLIEKPLALELDEANALLATRNQAGRFAAVAYVQRFHPTVGAVRNFLREEAWGPTLQANLSTGQNFPSLRPAYREIYYRDRAQGGGCIHDALTHTVDAIGWMLGPASRVYCAADHQALEGVSVEDTANVIARHGPALVSYTINQFQAPNEARWDFHTAHGSVRAELRASRWGIFPLGKADWSWTDVPHPGRDGLFLAQANAFLDACEKRATSLCSVEEGIQTLRFSLAAFQSMQTGRHVDPLLLADL